MSNLDDLLDKLANQWLDRALHDRDWVRTEAFQAIEDRVASAEKAIKAVGDEVKLLAEVVDTAVGEGADVTLDMLGGENDALEKLERLIRELETRIADIGRESADALARAEQARVGVQGVSTDVEVLLDALEHEP